MSKMVNSENYNHKIHKMNNLRREWFTNDTVVKLFL